MAEAAGENAQTVYQQYGVTIARPDLGATSAIATSPEAAQPEAAPSEAFNKGLLYDEEVRRNAEDTTPRDERGLRRWIDVTSTPESIAHAERVITDGLKEGDVLEESTGTQWLVRRSVDPKTGRRSVWVVPADDPKAASTIRAYMAPDGTWKGLDKLRPIVERALITEPAAPVPPLGTEVAPTSDVEAGAQAVPEAAAPAETVPPAAVTSAIAEEPLAIAEQAAEPAVAPTGEPAAPSTALGPRSTAADDSSRPCSRSTPTPRFGLPTTRAPSPFAPRKGRRPRTLVVATCGSGLFGRRI
jgi:hypothetical protein